MPEELAFDGTVVEVPFGPDAVQSEAVQQYQALLQDRVVDDILVFTGSPTSTATFRAVLDEECPGAHVPRISSVIVHATDVVNRADERAILSDAMRRELLHRFLNGREWDASYLDRAATQESFVPDLTQFLETASWQNVSFEEPPELSEIGAVRDEFHEYLADHDHMERGQLISTATKLLEQGDAADAVSDINAILVLEFEEFLDTDRRYLQALADGCELVCIAERDASIRRTWSETGPVTDYVSFTNQRARDSASVDTRPAATATYLAHGDSSPDPDSGSVAILAAETADEELEAIANKIERIRTRDEIPYSEIAVAFKQGGDVVVDAMRTFERTGIPTESATVIGFGDDPGVRELLRVACTLADDETAALGLPEAIDGCDLDGDELEALSEMEHIGDAVRRWATETGVKARIGEDCDPLTARTRFGNLRRAFTMADFLEDTEFMKASWTSFAEMLSRAHTYAPQRNQTGAIERRGGVRVDHVQAVKNGSFQVVFVPHVTDDQYPGRLRLSTLFPDERVMGMPEYPGVTNVDTDEVTSTFETDSTASTRPLRQYHAEHARRSLAIAAASATDLLYFGLHTHEDSALDTRVQPSRFLATAYRALPWIGEGGASPISTEQAAEEFLLSRVDRALADVRRSISQDVELSLDSIESEFGEIQMLLENSGERGEQLKDALQARLDFADGRVRRE